MVKVKLPTGHIIVPFLDKVKIAITDKISAISQNQVPFNPDTSVALFSKKTDEFIFQIMTQPLYTVDLAPLHFHLFPKFKSERRSR